MDDLGFEGEISSGRTKVPCRLGPDKWPAIKVLIEHVVTNARNEAGNTSIQQIKRTRRGYQNSPITKPVFLTSAARHAA